MIFNIFGFLHYAYLSFIEKKNMTFNIFGFLHYAYLSFFKKIK